MIVDDDDDARELLADLLRRSGYAVVTARDGQEALDLLHVVRPRVIFVDLMMPNVDGAHFREEQRRHVDWLKIPTIVMTGSQEEPQLDLAVEHTLKKPVRASELLEIVRRHCERR